MQSKNRVVSQIKLHAFSTVLFLNLNPKSLSELAGRRVVQLAPPRIWNWQVLAVGQPRAAANEG